jgi:hypothetical protein
MPPLTGKRSAAKVREATKRGEIPPADAASLKADPTYVDIPIHHPDVATGSKPGRDDSEAESSEVGHKRTLKFTQ